MIQSGNENMSLSTNTVVVFISWTAVYDTLCCSSVNHWKQGTEAKQPSPFLSQLPFQPHAVCICRFDLMVRLMILSNTGLCPKHTTQNDLSNAGKRRQNPRATTLVVFGQGLILYKLYAPGRMRGLVSY